jgi:hypothetical protein
MAGDASTNEQKVIESNMDRDLNKTFKVLAAQAAREEMEKVNRLLEAGYDDLVDKVLDGEIDVDTAMLIFGGRRP